MAFSFRSTDWRARFRALFEEQGWKQIPFAEKVVQLTGYPMSQSRVSAILLGRAGEPSFEEIEALCAVLKVDPRDLLFPEAKPRRNVVRTDQEDSVRIDPRTALSKKQGKRAG